MLLPTSARGDVAIRGRPELVYLDSGSNVSTRYVHGITATLDREFRGLNSLVILDLWYYHRLKPRATYGVAAS